MATHIDVYLSSLVRFNATAVVLASDSNVSLRFPTGERFANQSTSHADLVAMVDQIAPSGPAAELRAGQRITFPYRSGDMICSVTVEPKPGGKWRVVLEPQAQAPAARSARPAPAPGPAAPAIETSAPRRRKPSSPAPPLPIAAEESSRQLRPIERMLARMYERGASDLHLSTGNVPKIRQSGEIMDLGPDDGVLDAEAMMQLLAPIVPPKNRAEFEERSDTDFAVSITGVSRFRANMFRDRHGPGAVFRAIPFNILSPEQIGLPKGVLELCFLSKGLVVVTGPTGSGKSTTLATLVDHVNKNRTDHIITIEDPIEFVHENKGCLVNQREVHTHTRSFKDALRAALREDPDIVLVGEMRDLETIAIAVETAETGHLVFGTLHTTTAPSTVDRIIDQFPADRQEQIRQMLSESLRGVIAQTLCKKIGGAGWRRGRCCSPFRPCPT